MKELNMRPGMLVLIGMCGLSTALVAQNPPPPPPAKPPVVQATPVKPEPPPAPAASLENRPNIRLELRITDNYSGSPIEKTVSMLMLSGFNGRVRTSNMVPSTRPELKGTVVVSDPNFGQEPIQLNVDAVAEVIARDRIQTRVTFEYRPAPLPGQPGDRASPATLNESLNIMLRNGQPLVVSQSADPASDRKVTVELTATILP